jgi:hypothetical protein
VSGRMVCQIASTKMRGARTAGMAAALLALGCALDFTGRDPCRADGDCLAGRHCAANHCVPAAPGSGGSVAGGDDAGSGGNGSGGSSSDAGSGVCASAAAQPGMVCLTFVDRIFWIDVYEASLVPTVGKMGSANQDTDGDGKIADPNAARAHARSHGLQFDEDPANPGTVDPNEAGVALTTVIAQSVRYRTAVVGMSFWQAAAACANAGKRLCTGEEWKWACSGAGASNRFAYGNEYDGGDEPGHDCWTMMLHGLALTGNASACVTPQGLYDMSGSVEELTDIVAGFAQIRGGWASGPGDQSSCGTTFDLLPAATNGATGFRCCKDP